jgi:hypothetical protein
VSPWLYLEHRRLDSALRRHNAKETTPVPDLRSAVETILREAVLAASVEIPQVFEERAAMRERIAMHATEQILAIPPDPIQATLLFAKADKLRRVLKALLFVLNEGELIPHEMATPSDDWVKRYNEAMVAAREAVL